MEIIRLTQTTTKTGCAAKVAAEDLRDVLKGVRFNNRDKNLLVDASHFDDAAIYRISDELALVQTLDFFTPLVDEPYEFGAIASANALSDVYAMGGLPKTAMGILGYPVGQISNSIISEILQGAGDLLERANASMVGGHSVDDDTLKFGLSVTGFVHPDRVWSNQGAQVGDHLILTKPLGTGTLTTALKRGVFSTSEVSDCIDSMKTLNRVPELISIEENTAIHAATDITGFGLSGHSLQMAKASQVGFRFIASTIPRFHLASESLSRGLLTKAHRSNQRYTNDFIRIVNLSPNDELLIHDPQTSGGLLLCVDPNLSTSIVKKLKPHFPSTEIIGEVVSGSGIEFTV